MIRTLKLAFRSLLRNRRRSAVTLGAVALGVAVVIFAYGFGEGLMQLLVRTTLENRLGAIQIHRKGYLDSSEVAPLKLDLKDVDALLAKVRAVDGVKGAAPRIRFAGMINNGRTSAVVMAEAIDPVAELQTCPGRAAEVPQHLGRFVSADAPHAGVIGGELATALGASAGASMTVSAAGREGGLNALDLDVGGITRGAGNIFEGKRVMVVPLLYAQELLQMNGSVTEIAVRVDDLSEIPKVAAALKRALGPDLEVSTWEEVLPFLRDAVNRLRIVLTGVSAVLFFIVVFGVINTMLMNVYERVREIGTMLAVGVRRSQVLLMFMGEALAIGVVGGAIGAVAGLALTTLTAVQGISVTPPGALFQQVIHPVPRIDLAIGAVVVAVIGALIAAAYPARKASLMNPVDALRTL